VCGGWKARKEKWRHRSVAISIVRFIWNFQIAFRHLKEYRTEYSGALAPENKNDDTEVPSFLTARYIWNFQIAFRHLKEYRK
jgi:hypothetical protein